MALAQEAMDQYSTMSQMVNSDNEHSHSKRCNNCSGTTFRPRRSSSGTKLRVTGKDWSFIYSKGNVLRRESCDGVTGCEYMNKIKISNDHLH